MWYMLKFTFQGTDIICHPPYLEEQDVFKYFPDNRNDASKEKNNDYRDAHECNGSRSR